MPTSDTVALLAFAIERYSQAWQLLLFVGPVFSLKLFPLSARDFVVTCTHILRNEYLSFKVKSRKNSRFASRVEFYLSLGQFQSHQTQDLTRLHVEGEKE